MRTLPAAGTRYREPAHPSGGLFWLAPLVGAGLAGLVHHHVIEERPDTTTGYG